WRDQTLAMSHDSFYENGERETAEEWQAQNDEAFIGDGGAFADKDMRMFAYTFGKRSLEETQNFYYEDDGRYSRLQEIKKTLDPDCIFSADEFSLNPRDK
ncbi:MAG: hypothetical protein F6K24_47970, partial [Okeania sp. SIO2D1]|nr:hypothetical protein [Okeania sp. SIO2D1]